MKKVLIAIDYNPVSEKVAEEGHKLAKQMGAQVCLLHVTSDVSHYGVNYPAFMGYEGYAGMPADIIVADEMRKVGEDFLQTAAKHLDDPDIHTRLVDGETANAILDYAEEWNADLVVMGTHSHSVLEKIFMGTVASKVLEKTKIPVYMIPVKK